MEHLYDEAVAACVKWIATARVDNASDNDEDVKTYSTDEEVVMLYMKDLSADISKLLPAEIARQINDTGRVSNLRTFILLCIANYEQDAIYKLFEDGCTQELRDQIYSLADPESPEPFRSAMINMGFPDY